MNSFEEVTGIELAHVAGGVAAPLIAGGLIIGVAIAGAFVLGNVYGATSDECKKPK